MIDLAKLDALCEAATAGPWTFESDRPHSIWPVRAFTMSRSYSLNHNEVCSFRRDRLATMYGQDHSLCTYKEEIANAAFIAAARQAVPELVAEVKRLSKSLDDLQRACMQGVRNMREGVSDDAKT